MKRLNLLLVMGFIFSAILSHASNTGVGGGGGIVREGQYLTFGTAKITLGRLELTIEKVPGLELLLQTVSSLPIPVEYKNRLLQAILPSSMRKYYGIEESTLTEKQRNELLEVYSQIAKMPKSSISLFAITSAYPLLSHQPLKSVPGGETYILPEFYQLTKESERAAILWHEAIWAMGLEQVPATYQLVLRSEIHMQAYIEKKDDASLLALAEDIGELVRDRFLTLRLAAELDKKNGTLDGLWNKHGGIDMTHFYPTGILDNSLAVSLYQLKEKYPNSLFLKAMAYNAKLFKEESLQDTRGENIQHCFFKPRDLNRAGGGAISGLYTRWTDNGRFMLTPGSYLDKPGALLFVDSCGYTIEPHNALAAYFLHLSLN